VLIKEAKRKEEIFKSLPFHLEKLKKFLNKIDGNCRVFLFGSVTKNDYTLMGDTDIFVKTKLKPNKVIKELRNAGFDEPFEFHVVNEEELEVYKCFVQELKEISKSLKLALPVG